MAAQNAVAYTPELRTVRTKGTETLASTFPRILHLLVQIIVVFCSEGRGEEQHKNAAAIYIHYIALSLQLSILSSTRTNNYFK